MNLEITGGDFVLGVNIRELRNKKGIYQQELADNLNVSKGAVAMWETDKREPDNEMLVKIANYFNTTIDYLLGRTDNINNNLSKHKKTEQKLNVPDELKDVMVAFHRGEFEDLIQSEIDALANIAATLKAQRLGSAENDKTGENL